MLRINICALNFLHKSRNYNAYDQYPTANTQKKFHKRDTNVKKLRIYVSLDNYFMVTYQLIVDLLAHSY